MHENSLPTTVMNSSDVFREKYNYEESRVSRYKERKRYGKLSEGGMSLSFLALLVVGWTYSARPDGIDPMAFAAAVVFAAGVFVASTGLWALSYYVLWKSGLTDETVAYYEIAAAMRAHDRGDLDGVIEHIGEARAYVKTATPHRISDTFRDGFVSYVDAVGRTTTPEIAVRDTFGRVGAAVAAEVVGTDGRDLDGLVAAVDPEPTSQLDTFRRAYSDLHDVFTAGMFGFWGFVVVAFALGVFVFYAFDEWSGTMLTGGILTTYGVYLRNRH